MTAKKTTPEIIDNPLSSPDQQSLIISPSQEVEKIVEGIQQVETLATITKEQLAIRRQRVEMEVETKKLDAAKKTISAVDKIIDTVMDPDTLSRVASKINTPQDMKHMAEAAEKLTNTLRGLMGGSCVDEFGNKKKTKINFMFKTSGQAQIQGAVQVENDD